MTDYTLSLHQRHAAHFKQEDLNVAKAQHDWLGRLFERVTARDVM